MIKTLYDLQKEFDEYTKPPKRKKPARSKKLVKPKTWVSIIPVK